MVILNDIKMHLIYFYDKDESIYINETKKYK